MALLRLAGRRLALAVPGLLGVIVVTFLLNRALPGDPAAFFAGPAATRQAIEEIRARLGLDKSVPEQFVYYVRDLSRGDLGTSLTTGQPVLRDLATRLPASLELTLAGLALAVTVALPLGVLSATRPGSWVDPRARGRAGAAHGARHLRAAQRPAAGDHAARDGVLLPARRQRAGGEGLRVARRGLVCAGGAHRLRLRARAGLRAADGHALRLPQPRHR